jgi:hypothetical protein
MGDETSGRNPTRHPRRATSPTAAGLSKWLDGIRTHDLPHGEPIRTAVGLYLVESLSVAQGGMLLGLIIVAGAWLAGPGRRATQMRETAAPVFREPPALARGALAVLLLLLILWGPVPWTQQLVPLALLTVAAYVWLELLMRRTVADLRPVPATS